MAEPYYATADDLRTTLDVDSTALSDAAANALIEDAEDLIDQQLGARWIDDTTGRKVVQADVDAWRWAKLNRATLKLAARLYKQPALIDARYRSVSGPDFSFTGPTGQMIITSDIDALLNASGLRRLGGRARGGPAYRGWRGVLLDDGSWDDEPAWTGDDADTGAFG